MPVPTPPPDPSRRRGGRRLSDREHDVLARIEADLSEAEPALARRLRTHGGSVLGNRRALVVVRLALIVPILAVLCVVTTLLPATLWWPVLPALTGLLVVPWLLHCARPPAG